MWIIKKIVNVKENHNVHGHILGPMFFNIFVNYLIKDEAWWTDNKIFPENDNVRILQNQNS